MGQLRKLIQSAPAGALELQPDIQPDYVAFKIIPANPKSASIRGEASTQGGISFTVGQASTRELSIARHDFFIEICKSVFTSHFTERIVQSASGRVLFSRMVLTVKGEQVRLGGHQIFWWLFPRRATKTIKYEPYY